MTIFIETHSVAMILFYFFLVAALTLIEAILFSERWKDYEIARITMGVLTQWVPGLVLVAVGILDATTWFVSLFAFGAMGAVKAIHTLETAARRERARETGNILRQELDRAENYTG